MRQLLGAWRVANPPRPARQAPASFQSETKEQPATFLTTVMNPPPSGADSAQKERHVGDDHVDPNYRGDPADYPLYLRLLAERDRLPAKLRPREPDPEGPRNLAALEAAISTRSRKRAS